MNIKFLKDNFFFVVCIVVDNGKGFVIVENVVCVMYNFNEIYFEYQYLEIDKNEGMENFVEDN